MNLFRRILPVPAIALMFAALAAAPAAAPAPGADLTPRQLLEKTIKTYDGIKSHKFLWLTEGMDTFTKDRQKDMTGHYDSFAKKAGVENKVEDKPKLVRGSYEIKNMKPYFQQMKVIETGFAPKIVWGTLLTYRADKDPEAWWAKPKILPFAIKRSVANDDSAGALTANWAVTLLYMTYYADNAATSLAPEADVDGRRCYVLRYTFDWTKRPKWTRKPPPFERFDVPVPIRKLIWDGMLDIEKQKFSSIDYFIDKEKLFVVKSEEYINGRFHWRHSYKDIEINTLTEKDF